MLKTLHSIGFFLMITTYVHAQTQDMLLDFGGVDYETGNTAFVFWNDITTNNVSAQHKLVNTAGAPTGVELVFTTGKEFSFSNNSGVQNPLPGSPLHNLSWPSSAMRDCMYSSSSKSLIEFTLSGLDPTSAYDFTLLGSRLGSSEYLTTLYQTDGDVIASAILNAANNIEEVVTLLGIRPSATGDLLFQIRAATSNSHSNKYFYLNALRIREHQNGAQPPLIAFNTNLLETSRVENKGAFKTSLTPYTNNGFSPAYTLSAVDHKTGLPPTWITLPDYLPTNGPFSITIDESAAGLGSHSAFMEVKAPGYMGSKLKVTLMVRPKGGPMNLLYYGNSYSMGNNGIHSAISRIAEEAGFSPPFNVPRLKGGMDLHYHLTNPEQAAAITNSLMVGEEWDFVVLQGFSLEATNTLGNPAAFISNGEQIYVNVKNHSPGARACLFQTWARGEGHSVYTGAFSGPMEMHLQIEENYTLAAKNINDIHGADSARRAAAGECVALLGFDPIYYTSDLSHPKAGITLLTSCAIFTAIYQKNVSALPLDFSNPGPLADWLTSHGMTEADWSHLCGIADRVAAPSQRLFPGSGENFLLETGVNSPVTAIPNKEISLNDALALSATSPAKVYHALPCYIYMSLFPTGFPPSPNPVFPEIRFDLQKSWLLAYTPNLPTGGLILNMNVPISLPGYSVLVQGIVAGPSDKMGNPVFTTSDGHELRFK